MFSLVAAASGLYSLSQVGGALDKITKERVPVALSWLELSRRVESVVRAAPALLLVDSESARATVMGEITQQAEQLAPIIQRNTAYETNERGESASRVENLIGSINENLVDLDKLVKKRLSLVAHRDMLIRKLTRSHNSVQRTLAPGARILGSQIAGWDRGVTSDAASFRNSPEQFEFSESIVQLLPQQRAAVLTDGLHNNLHKVTSADSPETVDILIFPLKKSLQDLSDMSKRFPKRVQTRMEKQIGVFAELTVGTESLPDVRKEELAIIAEAEKLLAVNVRLSKFLTNRVNFLVERAKTQIEEANLQAADVQSLNKNVLIGIVILSLVSSFLIVWLYVGRNLIARLTALSDSMLAIAGGNLHAQLPRPGGDDEISRMAEVLTGFRDTAIEVEESNMRDIEQARRRLVDAIENSSEGFAFFDPEDQLVICNSRYRELLYPGSDINIEPGMTFEAIIRMAASEGYIPEAEGRIDEWLAERMVFHHDPGEPRLQQRSGGQWILITERKTGDGGTVAVYSDITDLKQREEDLTIKSNALEQLSNQLAKYLSPQVYDSIFSGKQEVKLASQRKRLTVFFSDLVGFTETTEQLESEDLTHLLNQYLTEMSQIAIQHGATIDKYVGDAIVIFFGDPETLGIKEDSVACVTMAIAMRKRMKELDVIWREAGLEKPLQCRMGINTGVCTVGNFGSDDRMDYTIIGSGVNLAARLETACAPNEILISYETHAHIKDLIDCEEAGEIVVKGISGPITIYKVIDLYENQSECRRPIHARSQHFQFDADISMMSDEEKRDVSAMLLDAAERLSNGGARS